MELDRGRETALDADGHQGAWVAAEILLGQVVVGMIGKTNVIDPLDVGMSFEEVRDLSAVFDMAFQPQGDGFDSLQQQESAQRSQDRPGGALVDAAATRNVCGFAKMIGIDKVVIGVVRLAEHWETSRMFPPGKIAAIDNRSTEGCAVASHELGEGLHNDVGAP